MLVAANLSVESDQGTIVDAGGCHDHLIGGVAVKGAWELGGLDGEPRREVEQPHARVGQRLVEPFAGGNRQCQAIVLDQLGDFPA